MQTNEVIKLEKTAPAEETSKGQGPHEWKRQIGKTEKYEVCLTVFFSV